MPRSPEPTSPRRASRAREPALPEVEPQLATLVTEPPAGERWLHEIKFDGYRALAYLDHGEVRLVSRNGLSFNTRFAEVCRALSRLRIERAILDGEVCALDPAGKTRFEALQQGGDAPLVYFVFDLLWEGDEDLRALPLEARKERLAKLLPSTARGVVRRTEHVRGDGASFLKAAERLGLEGLIAKRADRPYVGGRSLDWQKVKVDRREELVVAGFTPPKGARQRFGSLLLAIPDDDDRRVLRYSGKVGTGFDTETLEALYERMVPLRVDRPPVVDPPRERGAVWIRPEIVVEVRFTEWTRDGKLRHPAFLGVREDKTAKDVRRERAVRTTS